MVTESADPGFDVLLGKGLDEFNEHAAGLNDRRALNVIVKTPRATKCWGARLEEPPWDWLFSTCSICRIRCVVLDSEPKFFGRSKTKLETGDAARRYFTQSVFRPLVFMKKMGGLILVKFPPGPVSVGYS